MRLGDKCGYKDCLQAIVNQTDSAIELDEYLNIIAKRIEKIAT
ncbi:MULTISPECIES: hypothetical protein [unclassified Ruminococcus]|nr:MULTISPECIES: hypothetical protein [unclassified Ruminococcus]